jgi:phosphoribosylformylglycinamidine (FGAM) synthase-like enzyme
VKRVIQPGFKTEGDVIALLGETHNDLSLSEYSVTARNGNPTVREGANVPHLDLNLELAVQAACLRAAEAGLLKVGTRLLGWWTGSGPGGILLLFA